MSKNMILLFNFLIIALLSCCDTSIVNPDPVPKTNEDFPKILWRKMHGPERFDQLVYRTEIYKGKLIAGYQSSKTSGFWIYDINNGDLIKDIPNVSSFINPTQTKLLGSKFHIKTGSNLYRTIDMETYEINELNIAKIGFQYINPINEYDGYIYAPMSGYFPPNKFTFGRAKVEEVTQNWDTLFSDTWDKMPNARSCHLSTVGGGKNDKGESLLFFVSSYYYDRDRVTSSRLRYQAYNLTKNNMEWTTEVPTEQFQSETVGGQSWPVIFEDIVIMSTLSSVRGFNKNTGKMIWEKKIPDFCSITWTFAKNGSFYIASNLGLLYQINMANGSFATLDLQYGNTGLWREHRGIIYLTQAKGELLAIDTNNFTIKWRWKSPNQINCSRCAFANHSPTIDEMNDRLYISDGLEMFCIKLPE